MKSNHAIARVDHRTAVVLHLDESDATAFTIEARSHPTAQHHSGVRSEHEFFGEVCDALKDIAQVLVVGPHTGLADFQHYVNKHRPAAAPRLLAFQVVDHPSQTSSKRSDANSSPRRAGWGLPDRRPS